ncbi:MAG: hypothetical protein AAF699_06980 [Pseudomonadota bacterium]
MSSHNEKLQPTPFEVVKPEPVESADNKGGGAASQGTPHWVLPALGGLLILVILVFFWLPDRVSTTGPAVPAEPVADSDTTPNVKQPAAASTETADTTPWSDAQLAKLRKEAQDVLAELLEVQETLEEKGVENWGKDEFDAVATLAKQGDELYRNREYEAAKEQYAQGLAQLKTLEAEMPAELARQLATAETALEDGDLAAANAALDIVDMIDPGNMQAAQLRQRVAVLPQLLELLENAAVAESQGDLPTAISQLEEAVALDPLHQRGASELARVVAAYNEQRFNEAMSEGYAALDANRFDTARSAFRRAAGIQQGSQEAALAIQEVEASATAFRLSSLQNRGDSDEQAERWQDAVEAYEQAQKIDPNILFAKEGLERSRDRARLDKQFRAAIGDPSRLSDVAVAKATEQMLQMARSISPKGPVLIQQIDELESLLQQANTPINVTIQSDMETDVVVYKVAKLGKFDQRQLELRPGSYTAVGSRLGYRDVRVDFEVQHGVDNLPVTIRCTETI